jgi:hypothetical protein
MVSGCVSSTVVFFPADHKARPSPRNHQRSKQHQSYSENIPNMLVALGSAGEGEGEREGVGVGEGEDSTRRSMSLSDRPPHSSNFWLSLSSSITTGASAPPGWPVAVSYSSSSAFFFSALARRSAAQTDRPLPYI